MKKKLSIYSSILAILLCMTVIVGATFALFTSKSGINIAVNAANVNIVATINQDSLKTYSMGVEQPRTTADSSPFELGGEAWFDEETADLTMDRVAPGDKATFTIEMENKSDIDVLYKVTWKVEGELYGGLKATADGNDIVNDTTAWMTWADSEPTTKTIEVSIELPVTAGNEYQGKSANISFTVEAVQGNADVDEISTTEQFMTFVLMGGGEASVVEDIVLTETITIPTGMTVSLNMNGHTITKEDGSAIVNNGTLIIDGSAASTFSLRAVALANGAIVSGNDYAIKNNGRLIVNNLSASGISNAGTAELKDCEIANEIPGQQDRKSVV